MKPPELRAKAVTREEFERWSRNNGGGGNGNQPEEPSSVEKKIRGWAEKLLKREQDYLEENGRASPRQYVESRSKISDLRRQFSAVSNPGLDGTIEAVKVLWRYNFGLRTMQPEA